MLFWVNFPLFLFIYNSVLCQSVRAIPIPSIQRGSIPTNVELVHCSTGYYVAPNMINVIRKDDTISPRWASFLHLPVMSVDAFNKKPARVKEAILDHNSTHLNKFGIEPKVWHYRKEFHEQFAHKLDEWSLGNHAVTYVQQSRNIYLTEKRNMRWISNHLNLVHLK